MIARFSLTTGDRNSSGFTCKTSLVVGMLMLVLLGNLTLAYYYFFKKHSDGMFELK